MALLWLINTSTPALALLCSALHWIRYYKKHESRDDYLHIDKTFSDFNIPHIAAPIQFLSYYLVMRLGGGEHYICIVVHQSGIRSGVIFDQFWNSFFPIPPHFTKQRVRHLLCACTCCQQSAKRHLSTCALMINTILMVSINFLLDQQKAAVALSLSRPCTCFGKPLAAAGWR